MTARLSSARRPASAVPILVLAVITAVATACSSAPKVDPVPIKTASTVATDPATRAELARFYDQTVTWAACGSGFQCAKVTVPVNWDQPSGETLSLQLRKLPALGTPIGSLLINPGGPGVSGVDFVDQARDFFSQPVRTSFDIVGWDPRGVGKSAAIDCIDDATLDGILASDATPDTSAEVTAAIAAMKDFGQSCLKRNGDLIRHVDTVSTARDLDVLRAVVKDSRLTYYGASYGTFIGAWYAQLFPWRVGRIVLDGAVDPNLTIQQYSEGQAAGFAGGMRSFVDWCRSGTGCPLRGDVDSGVRQLSQLIAAADTHPLATGDPKRPLTQSLMQTGLAMGMYAESLWPQLSDAIGKAMKGNGAGLLTLSDMYNERDARGHYSSVFESNTAIYCLDHGARLTPDQLIADGRRLGEKYPPLGDTIGWGSLGCAEWPIDPVLHPTRLTAVGAAPILVVGTTKDPATPYAWAQSLASQLSSGVLLTREGSGHAAYHSGNSCIDSAIDAYLVSSTVPKKGTSCA